MRKRGLPKSPVRENCTPGSVRGAAGNGGPYRHHGQEVQQAALSLIGKAPGKRGAHARARRDQVLPATVRARAAVAKLVYAQASGACGGNPVEVRVLSRALCFICNESRS